MSLYDKNISEEKKASLEFAEASREEKWTYPSFALQIFHGRVDWPLIHPFPVQSPADKEKGDAFLRKLETFLRQNLDPNEVDRTGEIPEGVMKGLADLGAFAIKIPEEYGGLGKGVLSLILVMEEIAKVEEYSEKFEPQLTPRIY